MDIVDISKPADHYYVHELEKLDLIENIRNLINDFIVPTKCRTYKLIIELSDNYNDDTLVNELIIKTMMDNFSNKKIKKGDLIETDNFHVAECSHAIYDGEKIVSLSDYYQLGCIPIQMNCITEFYPRYWDKYSNCEFECPHLAMINFTPYLDDIKKNCHRLKYNYTSYAWSYFKTNNGLILIYTGIFQNRNNYESILRVLDIPCGISPDLDDINFMLEKETSIISDYHIELNAFAR